MIWKRNGKDVYIITKEILSSMLRVLSYLVLMKWKITEQSRMNSEKKHPCSAILCSFQSFSFFIQGLIFNLILFFFFFSQSCQTKIYYGSRSYSYSFIFLWVSIIPPNIYIVACCWLCYKIHHYAVFLLHKYSKSLVFKTIRQTWICNSMKFNFNNTAFHFPRIFSY